MFKYKKAVQVLNYFAKQAEEEGITLHKTNALKLMYLADKKHLIESTIRTITGDSYKAKSMGPVASTTFDIIETIVQEREGENEGNDTKYAKQYLNIDYDKNVPQRKKASKSISIKSKKDIDPKILSQSDLMALEEVWKIFGKMAKDSNKLWQETHKYPEGNQFENMDRSQQPIHTRDLISSTIEGEDDLLTDINEEEIKERKEIYKERSIPHEAIGSTI